MKMNVTKMMTATLLATTISFAALADADHHPTEEGATNSPAPTAMQGGMPMMGGKDGMPMMGGQGGMPMMQMMQQRHAMMDQHMQKMEDHMTNIESLLQQLVEQGKN